MLHTHCALPADVEDRYSGPLISAPFWEELVSTSKPDVDGLRSLHRDWMSDVETQEESHKLFLDCIV